MLTFNRWIQRLSPYFVPLLLISCVCPFVGGERLSVGDILSVIVGGSGWNSASEIFFYFRLPRVILAICTGGALALAGSVFQAILRNPLATPYTLGVTGGSSLGAVTAIFIPGLNFAWGPLSSVQFFSLLGSGLVTWFIYFLATRKEGLSMTTLLLAGVTLGIFCGAVISFLRYLASPNLLVSMERWIIGGLDVNGFSDLSAIFPFLLPGVGLLFLQIRKLNHLGLGDEMATGYGINVQSVQRASFIGGSLATAGVVSLTGPIGFIGLIVPHAVRRLSGSDYRIILPASFFAGGSLLVVCDTVSRTLLYPTEIPTGVITTLIGVPFFIHLLLSKKRMTGLY